MNHHQQVLVKVNTYVDEGIAPLVNALSQLDKVTTLESCQGDEDGAWVYFCYGLLGRNTWLQTARFAYKLVKFLRSKGDTETDICLNWGGSNMYPYIAIKTNPDLVNHVANLLYLWRP